jgi:hypothetical protein
VVVYIDKPLYIIYRGLSYWGTALWTLYHKRLDKWAETCYSLSMDYTLSQNLTLSIRFALTQAYQEYQAGRVIEGDSITDALDELCTKTLTIIEKLRAEFAALGEPMPEPIDGDFEADVLRDLARLDDFLANNVKDDLGGNGFWG